MKDGVPIGDVVYEKDGYAIYQIDGEEHKVSHTALPFPRHHLTSLARLALRAKPLIVRKTLPRNQIGLLRCQHFPLLHAHSPGFWQQCSRAGDRLLQQGENELGQ